LGFLRIGTNRRLYPEPLSVDEAWAWVDGWLANPIVQVVAPTGRHAACCVV